MDALREPRGVVQRPLNIAVHLSQVPHRLRRVDGDQLLRELEGDRQRDELLLYPPVELALERAAVRVGCQHEPLTRGAQPLDLGSELLACLEVVRLHRGSCPSSPARRQAVAPAAASDAGLGQPDGVVPGRAWWPECAEWGGPSPRHVPGLRREAAGRDQGAPPRAERPRRCPCVRSDSVEAARTPGGCPRSATALVLVTRCAWSEPTTYGERC